MFSFEHPSYDPFAPRLDGVPQHVNFLKREEAGSICFTLAVSSRGTLYVFAMKDNRYPALTMKLLDSNQTDYFGFNATFLQGFSTRSCVRKFILIHKTPRDAPLTFERMPLSLANKQHLIALRDNGPSTYDVPRWRSMRSRVCACHEPCYLELPFPRALRGSDVLLSSCWIWVRDHPVMRLGDVHDREA